jgi:hypothetical protein
MMVVSMLACSFNGADMTTSVRSSGLAVATMCSKKSNARAR